MYSPKKLSIWLLVLSFVLSACTISSSSTPVSTVAGISATPERAYPLPGDEITPGAGVNYVVPLPSADSGVVIGKIVDEVTQQPLGGHTIYLANIIWMTPAPSYTYALQENSSPHTMADEQGRFALGSVPPGSYVLMVWTPFKATVVIDPQTGKELDVRVDAGKTLDLGVVDGINPLNPSSK